MTKKKTAQPAAIDDLVQRLRLFESSLDVLPELLRHLAIVRGQVQRLPVLAEGEGGRPRRPPWLDPRGGECPADGRQDECVCKEQRVTGGERERPRGVLAPPARLCRRAGEVVDEILSGSEAFPSSVAAPQRCSVFAWC